MKNSFFLWLLCVIAPFSIAAQCREQDSLELVKLYNATNGPNWTIKTNWLTTRPLDTWYGIELNAVGCVDKIKLNSNRLNGTIPTLNLSKLTELYFNNNRLTGTIPNFALLNLKILYIGANQLTGTIPNFNLPNLLELDVERNQLTGNIPNLLLPKLTHFWADGNELTGTIPNFNFPKLQLLWLSSNRLTGSIPNFNCPNLMELLLNNNRLTGVIPSFNFPNLLKLYVGTNQLTGEIPNFNLPNLLELDVERNQLTGNIPNLLLPKLTRFWAGYNQLTGTIPNFNLPHLHLLHVYANQLTGKLPYFNQTNLSELRAEVNKLTDTIPNFTLPNLQILWIGKNQFTGKIPNFNLPKLLSLDVAQNQLSGSIPNATLPKLVHLWANNNQLSGNIPPFAYDSLRILWLNNNQLQGCIPPSIKVNCPKISAIGGDISGNPNLSTQSWANYWNSNDGGCKLTGWVDMHAHLMSHLAWGGKLVHGAPDVGILVPAIPSGNGCRHYVRAGHIGDALSSCNATHGGWGFDNTCGDDFRKLLLRQTESRLANNSVQSKHHEEGAYGYPNFNYWPAYNDMTHQQMWIDWIKRTYDNGLRVMVALAVNNFTYAASFSGSGDINADDVSSANVQIQEIKMLVDRHNGSPASVDNWMEIAYSAEDIRRIVSSNRLAIVLGMETDNIGNFHQNPNVNPNVLTEGAKQIVVHEIQRLLDQGVRYIFPIHVVDNKFGGTAIYEPNFNFSNYHQTGQFFNVACSNRIDSIPKTFESYNWLLGLAGAKIGVDIARRPPEPPNCHTGIGHKNALGLTPMGVFAIQEMMKRGMIIDIDHMSDASANATLDLALNNNNYPINSGHNGIRQGEAGTERALKISQYQRIALSGGLAGIGTDGASVESFKSGFTQLKSVMGSKGVAIGTDVNGFAKLPVPPTTTRIVYDTHFPICQTGNARWNYNQLGVAHYGLFADFFRDVKTSSIEGEKVVNQLNESAEYFAQMWEKCHKSATIAPNYVKPLFRLFNGRDHFYTISEAEANESRYGYETISGKVYQNWQPINNLVPFYRLWNGSDHFYTTNLAERNRAMAAGYQFEQVACYVFEIQVIGTIPMYRLYNRGSGDHFYTTIASERQSAMTTSGYIDEGIACYIFPNNVSPVRNPISLNKQITIEKPIISIYPNPVQHELVIESEKEALFSVELVDISGKRWLYKQLDGVKTHLWNVETVPNGIYLLRIKTSNGEIVKKISILKP